MNLSIQISDGKCLVSVRRKSRNFDPTTVECCSTVDLSAEDTQERCRARPVPFVEAGHDVERVAETMRVNDECVVLRRASAGDACSRHSEETMRVRLR